MNLWKENKVIAISLGNTKKLTELIPITSRASICSVTRIVPILEVIYDPTFPAKIIAIKVGENSKIIDCRVAKPTRFSGIKELSMFKAVCIETTPPTKNERKHTIPNEPKIKS